MNLKLVKGNDGLNPSRKVYLYVIYDKTAQESSAIFQAKNDGIANRSYRNLIESVPGYQRSDYRLYCLGTYDSSNMELIQYTDRREVVVENVEDPK